MLTAGHCYTVSKGTLPDNVLVGTNSLAHPEKGETLHIAMGMTYPDWETTEDVTVLVLDHPSTIAPRAIATGWARLDILARAPVEFVGYGSIDPAGNNYIDDLQMVASAIDDPNCGTDSACNASVKPDGELSAGGNGIDTCYGDSGGPMYLLADYGQFLAGVTSRGFNDVPNSDMCGGGGVYERPDHIVDWIEQTAGVPVTRGPEPSADPLMAIHGDAAETTITANDPKSDSHTYAVTTQPAMGTAAVRADGTVRVCVDPAAPAGADTVGVTITDSTNAARALEMTIPIAILDGQAGKDCDPNAFGADTGKDGGGCCSTGGGNARGIPLALGVAALVLRRRRRA
jgi:secreted trypsin-like serine protease